MQEECEDGSIAPLKIGDGAELSTYVCAACGYSAWYATAAQGTVAIGHACADCGVIELAQAGELREERGWTAIHIAFDKGFLEVAVCRECTRLRFTAHDIPFDGLETIEGNCRWCDADRVETKLVIDERSMLGIERRLPIAFHHTVLGERRRGSFTLRICRGCGDTEWHAEHLAELREDPRAGVRLLERKVAVGGPYR
jgi:hypothetical protein